MLTALWVVGGMLAAFGIPWLARPSQLKRGQPWEGEDVLFYLFLVAMCLATYLYASVLLLA